MGKKIYVGNLSFNADDQSVGDLFADFGAVESARIITDRETGRSKGFAFVEMATDEEASKAIEALNGKEFLGRNLNISEAKPMAPRDNNNRRPGGGRGGFGGGGNRSRY